MTKSNANANTATAPPVSNFMERVGEGVAVELGTEAAKKVAGEISDEIRDAATATNNNGDDDCDDCCCSSFDDETPVEESSADDDCEDCCECLCQCFQ